MKYVLKSLSEIKATPWNGLTAMSTFAGAGGSCLGLKMAGFRCLYANEFMPIAAETYKRNIGDGCHVDTRDVSTVTAEEILALTGLRQGELDVFNGSPPCQAFSCLQKGHPTEYNRETDYGNGVKQKNADLFLEYIRLVRGLRPKVFIAENVAGLAGPKAAGVLKSILDGLRSSGYKVEARKIRAQDLGVPMVRTRIFFVGVREDLAFDPETCYPKKSSATVSIRDALPEIASVVCPSNFGVRVDIDVDKPCPSISTSGGPRATSDYFVTRRKTAARTKFTTAELKRLFSFPEDFEILGTLTEQRKMLGNCVAPLVMFAIASRVRDALKGTS